MHMAQASNYLQTELWRQPARRWIFHVDMDAFFASVEQYDNPDMRGRPVVVANSPLPMERVRGMVAEARKLPHMPEYIRGIRGVVASASYEARVFGVRSAMPLARALSLCPDALVTPGRFGRYREVAEHLRRIWGDFSPLIEPMSLDEAFIDMTGVELSGGPIGDIGMRLKRRIREETGLTASVGIASSKLVAKIASDLQKPDGLVVVPHGEEAAVLAPLPVRTVPGIGPRTADALQGMGIFTCGQLAQANERVLGAHFGAEHAASLVQRALGIDHSAVEPPGDPKSVSRETTLAEDRRTVAELRPIVRGLADHVAWSLRQDGLSARCVYIKLRLLPVRRQGPARTSGFGRLITRQMTLPMPVDSASIVFDMAVKLLEAAARSTGLTSGSEVVRLVGVGAANLVHTADLVGQFPGQAGYVEPPEGTPRAETKAAPDRDRRLNAGIDDIRRKFGYQAITSAAGANARDKDDEGLVDG
jgi:DNA polymerase-4